MSLSLSPFPNSLLLSPLPPHHCSPETNRMASLVNSLHIQTPKAEETPPGHPPPPKPQCWESSRRPDEAASGTAELLELSGCSGNFFGLWALPRGLFLQLLVFPHLLRVLVLRRKGVKRGGHMGFPGNKSKPRGKRTQSKELSSQEVKSKVCKDVLRRGRRWQVRLAGGR